MAKINTHALIESVQPWSQVERGGLISFNSVTAFNFLMCVFSTQVLPADLRGSIVFFFTHIPLNESDTKTVEEHKAQEEGTHTHKIWI